MGQRPWVHSTLKSLRREILFHLFNLVDIGKSVIIPSNQCYQWAIEYSVESVDIMRFYTLSQGYDKYIKCALCVLYHALSLAISLYLAIRHFCAVSLHQRNAPSPLPFKIITAHPFIAHLPP